MSSATEVTTTTRPLGAIVPLIEEPNNSGWYEFASLANKYGSRLQLMALIEINRPDVTDLFLDSGIRMLDNAGVKVIANLYLSEDVNESFNLVRKYKKNYPKLSGVCFIDGSDNEDRTTELRHLTAQAKYEGYEIVIAAINVFDSGRNDRHWQDEIKLGSKYLGSTVQSHHIDIIMYYFYHGLPSPIQMVKSEYFPSDKFAIAVTKQRIVNVDAFRTIVKNVVGTLDVARYIYVEGGRDTGNYMRSNQFRTLSPYLDVTLEELEKIARREERLNKPRRDKKGRLIRMPKTSKPKGNNLYDDFGIKRIYSDREVPSTRQKLILIPSTVSYDEVNASVMRGGSAITYELNKKIDMENVEWTGYVKFVDKDKKNVRLVPETPLYQFAIHLGQKTFYDVNITYGGFLRVGKTVNGVQGRYRPGNGTNFPLSNWLGVKIGFHQYPSADNAINPEPMVRIDVYLDEHAQDSQGNLVIANNQNDRWRSAYSTQDMSNWIFDKKLKKNSKDTFSTLKKTQRGNIQAFVFRTAPGCRIDTRYLTMREVDPLRED